MNTTFDKRALGYSFSLQDHHPMLRQSMKEYENKRHDLIINLFGNDVRWLALGGIN